MPDSILEIVEGLEFAVSADEKAWVLTTGDFEGTAGTAFAWNEWEAMSLEAAGDDEEERAAVQTFWDAHFSLVYSVKSGYTHFAVAQDSMAVVTGIEPVFEETSVAAESVSEFLAMIARGDERLGPDL